MSETSLIFMLDAQIPYIRHPESPCGVEECRFFSALTFTYLPLLRACTALETEGVPFKLAISFSPTLCEMMVDPLLQTRYIENIDRSIDFGFSELQRFSESSQKRDMVKNHLDLLQLNRRDYVEIYEKNLLKKFDYFATHGYLEILATTATACFLPLYADIPEAINAQIETGLITYRKHFTSVPKGFWLPAMAWFHGCEDLLKSYGFQYTIVESHGLLFADPPPATGVFSPVQCSNGFSVFARDKIGLNDVINSDTGYIFNSVYLDVDHDIGFERNEEELSSLFPVSLGRRQTGFRYWAKSENHETLYDASVAYSQVQVDAQDFLSKKKDILDKASVIVEGAPVTLVYAFPASLFGQTWVEGITWLETLMRKASVLSDLSFKLPSSCLSQTPPESCIAPCYSSWMESGYADEVLNSTNDWMYPLVRTATLRMIDLADRFPDDTGLKERSLNMAARELLLAQAMDWALFMNEPDRIEYARSRFEESVRAFTTVYESLGSNFISTEWLTNAEKKHTLFPDINYRAFSRKK